MFRCAGQPLTVFGDGKQTRSFCYVSDLVEGFLRLMARAGVVHAPLPKDDPVRRNPNIARAQELLDGWAPKVPRSRG
jgi:UDP-glucuronate decarboxylase